MINNESLGAHLRNALTPYANLIELLKAFQAGEEFAKKYLLEKLDVNELQDNLTHIIDVSKIKEVEDINWRATDLYKAENENSLPDFNTCKEWVDSLPYNVYMYEYKGKTLCNGEGFEWENPYDNRWGARPEIVFQRLFKADHYYGLTEAELIDLRTTIQYCCVYLDDYFNKMVKMMEDLGFEIYKKEDIPGELIHLYMRRGNVSVYFSNQFQVQDYRPNEYGWQWGYYKTGKNGRKYRVLLNHSELELQDDFGEKTKQWVENYIKENLSQYLNLHK